MSGSVPIPGESILPLLVYLGCAAGAASGRPTMRPGDEFSASFRAMATLLLPPSLFFLIGVSIVDWPSARASDPERAFAISASLMLAADIYTRAVHDRMRLLPFLAGLSLLAVAILPLGIALERFLLVFPSPFRDDGHLGLLSLGAAAFALSAMFRGRSAARGSETPAPLRAHLVLVVAWIVAGTMAAQGSSPSTTASVLLVAAGTSVTATIAGSIAGSGLVARDLVLLAPMSGILAVLPWVAAIPLRTAALVGLVGGISGLICRQILAKLRIADEQAVLAAHLGGPLAGLLVAGVREAVKVGSPTGIALEMGIAAGFAAATFLTGTLFWRAAGLFLRLEPSVEERDVGLDLVEHGGTR